MNWIAIIILAFVLLITAGGLVVALRFILSRKKIKNARLLEHLPGGADLFDKLLAAPLIAWLALFLFFMVVLLFVSAVCLFYAFALISGEWFLLLDSLPKTAGNVIVHLIYPVQMTLFALITFMLAVGGWQLVIGPIEVLSRAGLRIEDLSDLARKLALLIALAAGLEVLKILFYSLLAAPNELSAFFARNTLPKAEPLGVALLTAAMLTAAAAWWKGNRRR